MNLDPDIHSDTDVSLSMNIDLINLILAICHLKISFILEILQNRIKRILNLKSINEIRDKLGFIDDFLSEEKKYIEMEINEHTNITLEQDLSLSIVLDNSNTMDEIFKASPCNDVVRFLRKKRAIEFIPDETVTNCQNCKNKFSMFYRKHHCRCCGRIYCYYCCNNYIPASTNLSTSTSTSTTSSSSSSSSSSVSNTSSNQTATTTGLLNGISSLSSSLANYLYTDSTIRVCNNCDSILNKYVIYNNYITALKNLNLSINELKITALINNNCRQASICILSSIREIQYKLPIYDIDDNEYSILYNSRLSLLGHSSWMFQLLRLSYQKSRFEDLTEILAL